MPQPSTPTDYTGTYTVTFDRIGRRRDVDTLTVEVTDTKMPAQQIAQAIHEHATKHLTSKLFDVEVDLHAMAGDIEQSRFGAFTLARA